MVAEADLLLSLRRLLAFHILGLLGWEGYTPVDVLNLSVGYYHERPEDEVFDEPFARALRRLRSWGVVVVVSAGNDGVTKPSFPAAFAPIVDRFVSPVVPLDPAELSSDLAPIVAVGALNPDGTTALFSNDGPWVTTSRVGASMVSTAPAVVSGALTASRAVPGLWDATERRTINPDGCTGGFVVWSGTSFAGPLVAGQIADALFESRTDGRPGSTSWQTLRDEQRRRGWAAVEKVVGLSV